MWRIAWPLANDRATKSDDSKCDGKWEDFWVNNMKGLQWVHNWRGAKNWGRSNMIFVRSFALGTIQSFYLQWQNHSIRKSKCNRGKRILKLLVKERNFGLTLWGVLKSQVSWPNPRTFAKACLIDQEPWNVIKSHCRRWIFNFVLSQKVRSFHIIKCFWGCHFISNRVWLKVFRWTLFEQI